MLNHVTVGRMVYMRESFYHSPSGKISHSLQCFFLLSTADSPSLGDAKVAEFVSLQSLTADNTNKNAFMAIKNMTDATTYQLWESGKGYQGQTFYPTANQLHQ